MSLKVYDKAKWHIEKGMDTKDILEHFDFMFSWLKEFNLLSEEGLEILDIGIDESISLNERMVNIGGAIFLEKNYDKYISRIDYGKNQDRKYLEELYFKIN